MDSIAIPLRCVCYRKHPISTKICQINFSVLCSNCTRRGFQRIENLAYCNHQKTLSKNKIKDISMAERTGIDSPVSHPHNGAKSQDVIEGTKNENESTVHNEETHGTSDDIDEKTPIDEVKAPGVFQRVKEEVEAVVKAVQPKK